MDYFCWNVVPCGTPWLSLFTQKWLGLDKMKHVGISSTWETPFHSNPFLERLMPKKPTKNTPTWVEHISVGPCDGWTLRPNLGWLPQSNHFDLHHERGFISAFKTAYRGCEPGFPKFGPPALHFGSSCWNLYKALFSLRRFVSIWSVRVAVINMSRLKPDLKVSPYRPHAAANGPSICFSIKHDNPQWDLFTKNLLYLRFPSLCFQIEKTFHASKSQTMAGIVVYIFVVAVKNYNKIWKKLCLTLKTSESAN